MNDLVKTFLILTSGLLLMACDDDLGDSLTSDNTTGGSLNRFAVSGDHLYIINKESLIPYAIEAGGTLEQEDDIYLGEDIETLIVKNDNLFVGARNGMHIFDISDRNKPIFLSTYRHVESCDPVAVQGEFAYVTLRSGSECFRGVNALDIINISNPKLPFVVRSLRMETPHGLAIDGQDLFITNGQFGLTRLFLEKPDSPQISEEIKDINVVDAIATNKNLILTGPDGIFQYDYTNTLSLKSKIAFQ